MSCQTLREASAALIEFPKRIKKKKKEGVMDRSSVEAIIAEVPVQVGVTEAQEELKGKLREIKILKQGDIIILTLLKGVESRIEPPAAKEQQQPEELRQSDRKSVV